MSRRSKHHYPFLALYLKEYAEQRDFFYAQYSEYHLRVSDEYTTIDAWTTGRYWIGRTDYVEQTKVRIVERGGEKGMLQVDANKKRLLFDWLDKLFYAADMAEEGK